MEDFSAMPLVLGFGFVNGLLYILMDRWIEDRAAAVASGVSRGVPLSMRYRWWNLQVRFVICAGTATIMLGMFAAGWFMTARNVGHQDARWFAYMASFLNLVGVAGWCVICPLWYSRLRSLLREAEAG